MPWNLPVKQQTQRTLHSPGHNKKGLRSCEYFRIKQSQIDSILHLPVCLANLCHSCWYVNNLTKGLYRMWKINVKSKSSKYFKLYLKVPHIVASVDYYIVHSFRTNLSIGIIFISAFYCYQTKLEYQVVQCVCFESQMQ